MGRKKSGLSLFLLEYLYTIYNLQAVARSYSDIAPKINSVPGFECVWITDGIGWKSAKNKLQEAYSIIPSIYNLTSINEFLQEVKGQ